METTRQENKFETATIEIVNSANAILNNWKANNKKSSYEEDVGLIKSLFARTVNSTFGWQIYKSFLKEFKILPQIKNHTLENLEILMIYNRNSNFYSEGFKQAFSKKELYNTLAQKEKIIELIDYESITKIKFN